MQAKRVFAGRKDKIISTTSARKGTLATDEIPPSFEAMTIEGILQDSSCSQGLSSLLVFTGLKTPPGWGGAGNGVGDERPWKRGWSTISP